MPVRAHFRSSGKWDVFSVNPESSICVEIPDVVPRVGLVLPLGLVKEFKSDKDPVQGVVYDEQNRLDSWPAHRHTTLLPRSLCFAGSKLDSIAQLRSRVHSSFVFTRTHKRRATRILDVCVTPTPMSRFSTPAKRPRDLDTSSSYGLTSPALSASSSLPTTDTSPQPSPTSSTGLGSPARLRTPSPSKGFAPPPRLPVFAREWTRMLTTYHPTYEMGKEVLEGLLRIPRLEFPVSLSCYPSSIDPTKPTVDLVRNIQCDLDALGSLPLGTILVDSRPHGSPPIRDGASARAALALSSPIALDVPPKHDRGIKAAPEAQLGPSYFSHSLGGTIVAGSGTLCPPHMSRSHNVAVLHTVIGQVVVLYFPVTNDNVEGPGRGMSLREQFFWAADQPQAALRVLRPGDSLFIPPFQWRAMITLGYNGSSYAAVTLRYAREVHGDGERGAKRHCS